jgi:transposase
MSKRTARERRVFSDEYKAEAVAMVETSGKSVGQVAKDLDLTETALRRWCDQARAGRTGASGGPESDEGELRRLREENRVLRMERDFLKKAAAFFAKESK